jgi:hypothetical protein
MVKSISGFCLNLNNQFIDDKCSDTGYSEEPIVQINGGWPDYKLFLWDTLFITALATTKFFFEDILILFFKLGISVLSGAGIYLENPKDCSSNYRF